MLSSSDSGVRPLVLLTGATGYIGGRLLKGLEKAGWPVRCLARHPEFLRPRVAPATEVVQGDCLDLASLPPRWPECTQPITWFTRWDPQVSSKRRTVEPPAISRHPRARPVFAASSIWAGSVQRGQSLSAHLRSRQEVADILRSSGVPTIEFRASIVIGSGSLSFEMIRALVQRLPVMICPRWVGVKAQPIAVEDVVAYLLQALELPVGDAAVFEIGGADQVSYGEIMQEYARQCGLRRWMIPVPVLTPRLSSLWLGLVTPIYARIGRKLVDSMRNPTLVRNPSALKVFDIRPRGLKDAIERALHNENRRVRGDVLVGRSLLFRKDPVVGRRALRNPARGLAHSARVRDTGGGFCAHPADWRSQRLVLCGFPVVVARVSGSSQSEASECGAGDATLRLWRWGMHWTSGEWKRSSPIVV